LNKTKIFFSFYAILSISVIGVQLLQLDTYQNILKPLLMPTLIAGYFLLKSDRFKKFDYFIIAALFFSMLGDAFLMPYFNIFMAGLGAFLMGHIFYLLAFIPDIKKPIKLDKQKYIRASIGFFFYAFLVIFLLQKLISTHQSPILMVAISIYATVLFSVFLVALLRNKVNKSSYNFILLGAALFLLSDGLLAINKFVVDIPLQRLWVMGTYTSAQAFLMYGSLERDALRLRSGQI